MLQQGAKVKPAYSRKNRIFRKVPQAIVAVSTHHLLKGRLCRGQAATAVLNGIGNVRFPSNSDRIADIAACLKRADFVAEVGCDGLGPLAFR